MHNEKVAKIAFSALLSVLLNGHSAVVLASEAPQTKLAATAALCKEAIVNPVSGYAECVRPEPQICSCIPDHPIIRSSSDAHQ